MLQPVPAIILQKYKMTIKVFLMSCAFISSWFKGIFQTHSINPKNCCEKFEFSSTVQSEHSHYRFMGGVSFNK